MSNAAAGDFATHTRFHGLDALRAIAMSLGIILHAAWMMIPEDAGAPKIDASANGLFTYLCLAIHTFRMQLFFVLAGLFACLLLQKRGTLHFLKNRVSRIVVPLVALWVILCPIMVWQYNAAGLQSGRILTDESAASLTRQFLAGMSPSGTLLVHLWFLNYLVWIYLIFMLTRLLIGFVDSAGKLRGLLSHGFGKISESGFSVVVFAVPFAVPLFLQRGAWGIEVSVASFVPSPSGLICYFMYFVAGWLLFHRIKHLPEVVRYWPWWMGIGVLLTLPFYFYTQTAPHVGYATWKYPLLTVEDIRHVGDLPDYQAFREHLLRADPDSTPGKTFAALPIAYGDFIRRQQKADEDQFKGLLESINTKVLGDPSFVLGGETTPDGKRRQLESSFAGVIHPDAKTRPFYFLQRAAFAYLFTVTSWSLIIAFLGCSQAFFNRASRFWRYYSDASYWFYLAHLPIQFQLLLWFGDRDWHPAAKFGFYVLTTFAVLVPSYHLLIRPTWFGYLLNGRMGSIWPKNRDNATTATVPSPLAHVPISQRPISESTSLELRR
ncbi:MAG: acyltransferase family protein [Planctomycetota bacterium]